VDKVVPSRNTGLLQLNYFEAEILLILAKDPVVQNRRMQVNA
jgi:hypothetical protein